MLTFPDSSVETEYTDPNGVEWAFDGVGWVQKIAVSVGEVDTNIPILDSPPANPELGQQWFSSTDGYLYIWYGAEWVAIGGAGGGDGGGSGGDPNGDTDWSKVALLINCDGEADGSQNIIDAANRNQMEVVNGAKVSTSVYKYGTGAIDCTAANSHLITKDPFIEIGTQDFCMEFWYRGQTQSARYPRIITNLDAFDASGTCGVQLRNNNTNQFCFSWETSTLFVFSAVDYQDNAWRHFAVTRNNGVLRGFINGTQHGNNENFTHHIAARKLLLMGQYRDNNFQSGYLDDVRITVGASRYTSDFTPPEKLPDSQGALTAIVVERDFPEASETFGDNDADLS